MMANDLKSYLSDIFPYKRKSSLEWIVPVSIGLGIGVTFGVGLGVLIAPRPGDLTRLRLRNRAERVKARAIDAVHTAQQRLQSARTQVSESSFADDTGNIIR